VAHALDGSLSRDGGRLVMEARLSGTQGEGPLWTQSFVGAEDALFDHMAVLIERTMRTLAPQAPLDPDSVRARTRFPGAFDIYAKFLAAYTDHIPRTAEAARLLLISLADLVRIMPDEPLPLALSAQSIVNCLLQGWSDDPDADRARGLEHARAALAKPSAHASPAVLTMAAYPLAFLGRAYIEALGYLDRSLVLNPNSAATHERSGWVRLYVGEPERAIGHFLRAKRLSPLDTTTYRFDAGLGFGHCLAGEYGAAVPWLQRAVDAMPSYTTSYRALAASLAHLDRREEAEAAARTLLRLEPGYRIEQTLDAYPPSPSLTRYVEGMRRAGLPE
jgi:adenylate cyclase